MTLRYLALGVALGFLASWCGRSFNTDQYDREQSARKTVMVDLSVITSIKGAEDPEDSKQEANQYGSGVVLASDRQAGQSIVVTAAHVVDVPDEIDSNGFTWTILERSMTVKTWEGSVCGARPLRVDKDADVAILAVDCYAGEPASFDDAPSPGASVYAVGAPDGFHPNRIFVINSGEFLGTNDSKIVTSIPGYLGYSGGGVWYRGRLIGIAVLVNVRFHHLSYAVPADIVKKAFKEAWDGRWNR